MAPTQSKSALLREAVFGLEDGMVSTLGSITGIAIGSQDHVTVVLAGCVIIAVESISMGIGSYISNRTEVDMNQHQIDLEAEDVTAHLASKTQTLKDMYVRDGWSHASASRMAEEASQAPALLVREMSYRQLGCATDSTATNPFYNGMVMLCAYIVGGMIPLIAYLLFPIFVALPISIGMTLMGLFALGIGAGVITHQKIVRSGVRMLLLGGLALIVGLAVGNALSIAP